MNSPISRLGGKRLLAKQIVEQIPEHKIYVELFAGAGWVYFKKDKSKIEVLNDINSELTTFFKVLKHHHPEFLRVLNQTHISRELFNEFIDMPTKYLTDVIRAIRFYYLTKCSFGSDMRTFVLSDRMPFAREYTDKFISKVSERIKNTFIENRDYRKILNRWDSSETLFYIDPPYVNCEDYYGKGIYYKEDHQNLFEMLNQIKGKFILSINDTELYRALYNDYNIQEVNTTYTVNNEKQKKVTELLIKNF